MAQDTWSAPESDVLASTRTLLESGRKGVLATIVSVEGSSYRRPGAKMLVPQDGDGVGSITAGCLEGETLRLADVVIEDGHPRIETFDLTNDEDTWGLGIGCNGVIDLLLEPIDERYLPILDVYESGETVVTLTITGCTTTDVEQWSRTVYRPTSGIQQLNGDPSLPRWLFAELSDPIEELAARGKSDTLQVKGPSGEVDVFVDVITPPPELVIFGTGRDVDPIVELASRNDFRVTVVGFRSGVDLRERFPEADAHVSTSPANVTDDIDFDADTYSVVATHNFVDDRITVGELVKTATPYVGIVGPRERFDEMLAEFEEAGRTFSESELDAVYTPVGLDLGSESPVQIATSIVSEVLAVSNDRRPQHLKERAGPIHERVEVQ